MVKNTDDEEASLPQEEVVDELGSLNPEELNEKYPNRPHNHSQTLPFHDLFLTLFNPLNENKKKPTGPVVARKKFGPHGPSNLSPHEARRAIIERFISRWRKEVGNDIYPAFRLIIPDKDRDRPMYGLKEKAIGKILVKVLKIDKNSEDGFNLLNWKLPGQSAASRMAGDFAGRCFEVISKRPMLTEVGDMTIGEVNKLLDKLAFAQKEDRQVKVFEEFYRRMNAEELMWLIRMILRQMKVGATERTFFDVWNPDAESLYSVSSSLRRVCWELYDPSIRLDMDDRSISLMQCFQPQLAQFQMHDFDRIITKMRPTEQDSVFWIEEKLDGERMQLHMMEDESVSGGKRFGFWSRKAKDYTYLYGSGFQDDKAALTRHLKDAFQTGVRNIILDGEMITWDPEQDAPMPFGTLKTAALSESRNPFGTGQRPLYRVFDCLYLNDEDLTKYTLRDRRRALEASVKSIHRRMEVHTYQEGTSVSDIEPLLRKVIAEASEGLVIKNPRSMYRLNERNDDWMKVKPEYMTEFGESLDCVVIGGYFGSGHRGGRLSSFLCGLRVDEKQIKQGSNPAKCYSFFKVGGGFTAEDYTNIRHHTEGKWKSWDPKRPPKEYIELGGGDLQYERPDQWIRPDESIVVSVKGASVSESDSFRMGLTLRFPRFKRLRLDRSWSSALSIQGFLDLKSNVEKEQKEKEFKVDNSRKRAKVTKKKELTVAGNEEVKTPYAGPETHIFDGLSFFVITESLRPVKKTKAELEQLIKANGGKIYQTPSATADIICTVKAASVQKAGLKDIVHASWIFDCLAQNEADAGRGKVLLPFEPLHMLRALESSIPGIGQAVDRYADSYARDLSVEELRRYQICVQMPTPTPTSPSRLLDNLDKNHPAFIESLETLPARMFHSTRAFVDFPEQAQKNALPAPSLHDPINTSELTRASQTIRFASGTVVSDVRSDEKITHIIFSKQDTARVAAIREILSRRRFVGLAKLG
ncbi:MAG: DNA ligase (ATP) [Chaenotheca gracillima]|nr:MAG: DNA ligase (ATP) [Chaenotheca gracillima]